MFRTQLFEDINFLGKNITIYKSNLTFGIVGYEIHTENYLFFCIIKMGNIKHNLLNFS